MTRDREPSAARTLAREVGRAYGGALGDAEMTFRRTRQRAAVAELMTSRVEPQRSRWGQWSAGVGLALTLALALALSRGQGEQASTMGASASARDVTVTTQADSPSTVSSGGSVENISAEDPQTDSWVRALSGGPERLVLGPSAAGVLAPDGAARTRVTSPLGAEVWLERGHVELDIEPDTGGRWAVHAGPFRVDVVGTVFSVDWDGAAETLVVEVARGEVRVTGGDLAAGGIAVLGGQRADVTGGGRELRVRPSSSATESAETDGAEVSARSERAAQTRKTQPRPRRATKISRSPDKEPAGATTPDADPDSQPPGWRALFQQGQYPQAYDAATLEGIDRLLRAADAQTLHELADVARLRRDLGLAERTLRTIRSRFPGSREAARAAFELGRIAADQRKRPVEARRWFELYLQEQPGGTWARDARGRVLRSLAHARSETAREAAAAYLRHHPDGPDADTARHMLEP